MRLIIPSMLLALTAICSAAPADVPRRSLSCAQNATEFALIYGYPLGAYAQFVRSVEDGEPNAIYHSREVSTASSRIIVRPNVDTLYSVVFYDLSSYEVEITVPEIKDRYYVFPFYDYYGDNYANVGTVSNAKSGKYLLRFANGDFGLQKGDSKYQGYVNSPTAYGAILVRIVVRNNSIDQKAVNKIQDQIKITPKHRPGKPIALALNPRLFDGSKASGSQVEKLLRLLAFTSPYNQPEVLGDRPWVKSLLEEAGLKNGVYKQPAGVNLTAALTTSNLTVEKHILSSGSLQNLNNGWAQLSAAVSGNFYGDYSARAFVAYAGYMQLTKDVALYPTWQALSSGSGFNVGPDEAYLFTFSSKPPLEKDGFWSLTAYGEDQYLIPNPLNVYTLGDRSSLRSPDGSLIYGGDSGESGKPFQILVQPADVTPPKNWTSNWLPAPAKGGSMTLNLRFYGPTEELSNGKWVYPFVEKVAAIRS